MASYSPIMVQWDSHAASEVARFNSGRFTEHQRQSLRVFKTSPDRNYKVGDLVLIQTRRHAFHKHSPIFFPVYEADFYEIVSIDTQFLPYKYHLKRQGSTAISKQLYGFEMKKVERSSDAFSDAKRVTVDFPSRVRILDAIHRDRSRLRSGKQLNNKSLVYYRILLDGREDIVPPETLRVLKASLGANALSYGPFFDRPENHMLLI